MASTPDSKDYPQIETHTQTWDMFCAMSKWVVIGCVIGLILMAAFLTGDHKSAGG
jgi:ABC-type transporter Mla maintaining outer membrane lipid asymmetry permease subunit MlaE